MEPQTLVLVGIAFALGGILKGATGAGAPIIAVPVLTSLFDVTLAIAVFVLPNILLNCWQAWQNRHVEFPRKFGTSFALAGAAGAAIGTYVLAAFSSKFLVTSIAVVLLLYIVLRLTNPALRLPFSLAQRIVVPTGAVAGILQGATGLSAPVSITFLSAIDLERPQFLFVISLFFLSLGVVQLPLQVAFGIMTWDLLLLSALALLPMLIAMPIGMQIGRRISRQTFDKVLLAVLSLLALRMLLGVFNVV